MILPQFSPNSWIDRRKFLGHRHIFMNLANCIAIVLAAGQGTRMKSSRPKVLHQVAHRSMLSHVLAAANGAGVTRHVVVLGPDMDDVKADVSVAAASQDCDTDFAIQQKRLGTGDAVKAARDSVADHSGPAIILLGDTPLLRSETVSDMASNLGEADIVVLGFRPDDPAGYGRMLLDEAGLLQAIVEHKDASAEERQTDLCFSGLMAFSAVAHLKLLDQLTTDNAQGEYYLTDIVALAKKAGLRVAKAECDEADVMGVNSRADLARAETVMQDRLRQRAMDGGVTMQDPKSVYLAYDTEIAADVALEPNVVFGPGVKISSGATIRGFSHLESATIGKGAQIGPYARLRPGAQIGEGAKVGNFVEIKKSEIGVRAKVNHLSYIGDATIGANANIGAGTITCNYDGFNKWQTVIGEGAFIGSNSALVAPVTIDDGVIVGSGSVVTNDVEKDALVVARGRQEVKAGWATRFRERAAKIKQAKQKARATG